jgi:hypothetical protein
MGWEYSMHGEKEKYISGENPEWKRPLRRPRHERMILKLIFKKWDDAVDWIKVTDGGVQ